MKARSKTKSGGGSRRVHRGDQREDILATARRVFFEKGYGGASMSEISAEHGGSKATLYRYFSSKDSLFLAAVVEEIERSAKSLFVFSTQAHHVETALAQIGRGIVTPLTDECTLALLRIGIHEARVFPEIGRALCEYGAAPIQRALAELLSRAHQNGDLNAPDPLLAAEQFFALCHSRVLLSCLLERAAKPTPSVLEPIIEAAVRTFMAAYGPHPDANPPGRPPVHPATTSGPA